MKTPAVVKASSNEIPEIGRLMHQADQVIDFAEFLLTSLIMAHARTVSDLVEKQQRELSTPPQTLRPALRF